MRTIRPEIIAELEKELQKVKQLGAFLKGTTGESTIGNIISEIESTD